MINDVQLFDLVACFALFLHSFLQKNDSLVACLSFLICIKEKMKKRKMEKKVWILIPNENHIARLVFESETQVDSVEENSNALKEKHQSFKNGKNGMGSCSKRPSLVGTHLRYRRSRQTRFCSTTCFALRGNLSKKSNCNHDPLHRIASF